jgi:hypothetical protein
MYSYLLESTMKAGIHPVIMGRQTYVVPYPFLLRVNVNEASD